MKKLFNCRRSLLAMFGMLCLTSMALLKGMDTSSAIAAVTMAVAAANAAQAIGAKEKADAA